MNKLTWFRQVALGVLLPLTLCAQGPSDFSVPESAAPAEVSQALRARVNEFFQYHVGTVNRKAIDLVAEDTKDYYFSSGKIQFIGFSIAEAFFTKDFQKAAVKLEVSQNWQIQEHSTVATTPVVTNWKIEDGKWVWYLDDQLQFRNTTPMGASAPPAPKASEKVELLAKNPDGTLNLPKDFAAPETVAAQGQAILQQGGLDKSAVTFTMNKAGQEQISFHNGFRGEVSLQLRGNPNLPGLKIVLEKANLGASEDGIIRFTYDPPEGAVRDVIGSEYTLRLALVPFNQEFPIKLTMLGAK